MKLSQTNRRGGQPGNVNALKHGRDRSAVRLAAKDDSKFYRECRKVLAQMDALATRNDQTGDSPLFSR